MTDAKLPKLAEGSRWVDSGKGIIDSSGDSVAVISYIKAGSFLEIEGEDADAACHVEDALAVIRRAGLDPLAIAAKELVDEIRDSVFKDSNGMHSILLCDIRVMLEKLEALL